MEQAEGASVQEDRLCLPQTPGDVLDPMPIIPLPSPERHLQHQRQVLTRLQIPHWFLIDFNYDKIIQKTCNSSDSTVYFFFYNNKLNII